MENEQNLDNLEVEQNENEETGEKKELTPEQIRGIKQRQLTRLAKDLGIELPKKEEKPQEPQKPAQKEEFDYGELAYLGVNGIQEEEHKLLLDEINQTGRELKAVLKFRHIQDELKSRAEDRKTLAALPETSRRAGSMGRDSTEYWLARGGLPPNTPENKELRIKVVDARTAQEKARKQDFVAPF